MSVIQDAQMEKSRTDDRVYRAFTLPNEIKCLVISDPSTDKASATLDVKVGSYLDKIEGEAHFLEHMLFMGTKKYPDENDYNVYLHSHGGSSNAYTDKENTNYHFDVSADHLEGALDRLAQFFIDPLLKEDAVDRERQAVDSENSMHLQSDYWRHHQLIKTLMKPDHPFAKFSTGNAETLHVEGIRESLVEFYNKHYSSNRMALVVLGKETVDELQTWVEGFFANVPNHSLEPNVFPGDPFANETLPKRLLVAPVQPQITVDLSFPLREVQTLYRSKPLYYVSHLLGHESAGSVLAFLKDRQWANDLSSGEAVNCTDWSSFSIKITLTETGLEHLQEVVEVVFAYLNMLRKVGPQEWVHQETATVADCNFAFLSRLDPIEYTSSLARSLHEYPPSVVLSGPYKINDYEPDHITEVLKGMVPSNLLLTVSTQMFEGKLAETEKWYGTEHTVEDIETDALEKWQKASVDAEWLHSPALALPERNDMIATDFSIKDYSPGLPEKRPVLLRDSPLCRLWYKPDNVFDMPKVNCLAEFRSPIAYESAKATVLTSLWQLVVLEDANEYLYLASMAGLNGSVVATQAGFELQVLGYNHKIHRLLERVIGTLRNVNPTQEVFSRLHDQFGKQLEEFLVAQPYRHAVYAADILLQATKWTIQDKMEALKQITLDDFISFSKRLLESFKLELLVHGNVLMDEAQQLADIILDGIQPQQPTSLPSKQVLQLDQGKDYLFRIDGFNPQNTNSCVHNIYLSGPMVLESSARIAVVHHLLQEPAFNQLRTEQQLGYVVFTSVHTTGHDQLKGVSMLIQSDSHTPDDVQDRMESFVQDYITNTLPAMADDEFADQKAAVVERLREKNKNMVEESSKHWSEIRKRLYRFSKLDDVAAIVETLTKDDITAFVDKYMRKGSPDRTMVSVQMVASTHKEGLEATKDDEKDENVVVIDDVQSFKANSKHYPEMKEVNVEPFKVEA